MSTKRFGQNRESGVVSLLTVIFFMIFVSLIVVGYIGIVSNDQRQTTDSDLSASAFAAARSGVEEGKRILLYCLKNADIHCTNTVLNSQDNCDVFKAGDGPQLATKLGIPIDTATGQGITGGTTQYQQYYSCLTIQQNTTSVNVPLTSDAAYIQQLKTTGNFTQLRVTWSGKGSLYNHRDLVTQWPNMNDWNASGYAPVIQLQIIPYSSFASLDNIEHSSSTFYIAPCSKAAPSPVPFQCTISPTIGNTNTDARTGVGVPRPVVPIVYGTCTIGTSGYTCTATLGGFGGGAMGSTQYYARAAVIYATSTDLTLEPLDAASNPVTFSNAQPEIEATGRANDVFRRVSARVSYVPSITLPQNALESAAPVCKDMTVTSTSGTYNCP